MLYLLRKMNSFRTAAKTLLVLVCALCSSTFAGKMAYSLQEAIYLFEMKGETDEAVRILEKIANTGDAEDKEDALFYLGKIQELAGNKTSANFYYNQSLDNTRETAKAYWPPEREPPPQEDFTQRPHPENLPRNDDVHLVAEQQNRESGPRYDCPRKV